MSILADGDILAGLQQGVIAAVAASILPTLPVKYIGRTLVPPDDQKWLELVFIPNNPNNDFWGEDANYMGMFRLILHWPNNDAGAYDPIRVIGSIAGYFTKDRVLQNVKIYETPKLMAVLEEGTETLYPVSLRYNSFQGN